jgi:hypothetical protein
MVLMFLGFVLMDLMTVETTRLVVLRNSFIVGAGMGLTMITSIIAVQQAVDRPQLGIATSTSQFFRSIGSAIGVAVMGTVMTQRMNQQVAVSAGFAGLRHLAEKPDAFLQPAMRATLPASLVYDFQQMLANALHSAFVVGTAVCLAAVVAAFFMPAVRLLGHSTTAPDA